VQNICCAGLKFRELTESWAIGARMNVTLLISLGITDDTGWD